MTTSAHQKKWRFDKPWIGPRIHAAHNGSTDTELLKVFALPSPKYGLATMLLVPVRLVSAGDSKKWIRNGSVTFAVDTAQNLVFEHSNWLSVPAPTDLAAAQTAGWLVVIAYDFEQTTLELWDTCEGINNAGVKGHDTTFTENSPKLAATVISEILQDAPTIHIPTIHISPVDVKDALLTQFDDWFETTDVDLKNGFIPSNFVSNWNSVFKNNFNFILGSCQYPAGLLDKKRAYESLQTIANRLDPNKCGQTNDFDFVVFAGDQIYADSTAGLLDPTRSDERLDIPYEAAFRAVPMRQIMSKVPTHMLLDDHEIIDNYEPVNQNKSNDGKAKKQTKLLIDGLEAYWKYQRCYTFPIGTPKDDILKKEVSYRFNHGCAAFYMLDTRSKREYRAIGKPFEAKMFSDVEMTNLCTWLLDNKEKIKFIITPSMLLPRNLAALNADVDHPSREDSWGGYPNTMREIFTYILDNDIQNTVFLSGDEHMSCHAKVSLSNLNRPTKKPIVITSVHASGLYAPFPFANAQREDFVIGVDTFELGNVLCCVKPHFAHKDTKFAKVRVSVERGLPAVVVEYHNHHGKIYETMNLLA